MSEDVNQQKTKTMMSEEEPVEATHQLQIPMKTPPKTHRLSMVKIYSPMNREKEEAKPKIVSSAERQPRQNINNVSGILNSSAHKSTVIVAFLLILIHL